MGEFKGTKGKWKEINGVLYDEKGDLVPSKNNFSVSGRLTVEEVFGKNKHYIKGKYNDKLKESAPEMLEMLIDLHNDLRQGAMPNSNEIKKIEQLIKEATEL